MATSSYETEHPVKDFGWAARDASGVLAPFEFSQRVTGEKDVRLKVLYCGISHSDYHMMKNEWGITKYPLVPGNEIVGVVTEIGSKVEKFKIGDKAGIGSMIGSCGCCSNCMNHLENYCPKVIHTCGGFSDSIVANEHFVVRFPESLPSDAGAPLLSAGITSYSAVKYYGLDKPGMHLGIVGLGGVGHLAVKFAKAFGVKVSVISTSIDKKQDAIELLGADSFLVSSEEEDMLAARGTMDGIIDTVSAVHLLTPLIGLLKTNGKLIRVGAPEKPLELAVWPLLMGRKLVAGSMSGGMEETQEMLDFAAKHNITADVEVISMDYVNTAFERLLKGDVRYRFVIDISNTFRPNKL